MINNLKELSSKLQETNTKVEITEDLFCYFLNVLSLREIGDNYFIFQDGEGEKLYFSEKNNKYFCYLLADYLITKDWKFHAAVSRPLKEGLFKVLFILNNDETDDNPFEHEHKSLVGREFVSVSAFADAMGVSFQ